MVSLIFIYVVMNVGKFVFFLIVVYNYKECGMSVLVFKFVIDICDFVCEVVFCIGIK